MPVGVSDVAQIETAAIGKTYGPWRRKLGIQPLNIHRTPSARERFLINSNMPKVSLEDIALVLTTSIGFVTVAVIKPA